MFQFEKLNYPNYYSKPEASNPKPIGTLWELPEPSQNHRQHYKVYPKPKNLLPELPLMSTQMAFCREFGITWWTAMVLGFLVNWLVKILFQKNSSIAVSWIYSMSFCYPGFYYLQHIFKWMEASEEIFHLFILPASQRKNCWLECRIAKELLARISKWNIQKHLSIQCVWAIFGQKQK